MIKRVGIWVLGLLVLVPALAYAVDTPTNTPTSTPTRTPTATNTATRTVPWTRTPTHTAVNTATATNTSAPTSTITKTSTPVPTATPTGNIRINAKSNAGCIALSDTPTAIGSSTRRECIIFWAQTGPIYCGYEPVASLSKTPAASSGAQYATGQGINRCNASDATIYCFGSGGTVCYDEVYGASPTATATQTPTPT